MKKVILILGLVFSITSCLNIPDDEVYFLTEMNFDLFSQKASSLSEEHKEEFWINIIDFSTKQDYDSGHVCNAENIELKFLMDENGYLVNSGKAITQRFDDRWSFIAYSSSNDTVAYYAAKTIQALGYSKVYYYEGNIEDWKAEGGEVCR